MRVPLTRLLAIALVAAPPTALAAAQAPVRLETRNGILEVHGLKDWTIERLNAEMVQRLGPDYSLDGRACGAFLHAIGFRDSEVRVGRDTETGLNVWTITVQEPGDSARSQRRDQFTAHRDTAAAARQLREIDQRGSLFFLLRRHDWILGSATDPAFDQSVAGQWLRAFVREHADSASQAWARWTVLHDGNAANRRAAAVMLAAGAAHDSTYYVLAAALRDHHAEVTAAALGVLTLLGQGAPPIRDWAPAKADLEHMMRGTNLWAHPQIYDALRTLPVDPGTRRALALAGEDLLLTRLQSGDAAVRSAAHQFLVAAAGRDLGAAPTRWRDWLRSLRPSS